MGAIIAIVSQLMTLVPKLVDLGMDVAPIISKARAAVDQIGTQVSPDDAEFKALDTTVKAWEDDFDAALAKRLGE